jgi:hypothetical protein
MTPTLTITRPGVAGAARPASPSCGAVTASTRLVVSTHKVRDRTTPVSSQWLPYGTQHAWEPGTRRTLCGEFINGWTVFWELTFSARPAAACPACVELTLPEASRLRLDRIARPVA